MALFSSNLSRPVVNNWLLRRSCFRSLQLTTNEVHNKNVHVPGSTKLNQVHSLPQISRSFCSISLRGILDYHQGLQRSQPWKNHANDAQFPSRSFSGNNLFTPMSAQEEEDEKLRVAQLSSEEKDRELRQLNRQIAILEKKRGINTGELYTWAGRYKALARDYGMPLVVWYWAVWVSTGIVCYSAIILFDVDVLYLLQQLDARTGWDLTNQINPEYGKIGMALVANEVIEPIRLPIVIVTVKPVMDRVYPPKF